MVTLSTMLIWGTLSPGNFGPQNILVPLLHYLLMRVKSL